jgi:WD40 repeat protein
VPPAVRLWNLDTGTSTGWSHPATEVLALHPHGHTLVSGGVGSGGADQSARLQSLAGKPGGELIGHTSIVETAAFTADGRTLATGAMDCMVRVWDLASGHTSTLINPHGGYVTSVAFSPDGRTLASGTRDGVARLWNVATGQHIATLLGHTELITSQAFSPDGRILATGSMDKTIRLWSTT